MGHDARTLSDRASSSPGPPPRGTATGRNRDSDRTARRERPPNPAPAGPRVGPAGGTNFVGARSVSEGGDAWPHVATLAYASGSGYRSPRGLAQSPMSP